MDGGLFTYCWDGGLDVSGGKIVDQKRLVMTYSQHGIKSERQVPMRRASWSSITCDGMDGVLAIVEGSDTTRVTVKTMLSTVSFTLEELLSTGYLRWPVGDKYAGTLITATVDGVGPFAIDAQVPDGCLDVRLQPGAFSGAEATGHFQREQGAWVAAGASVEAEIVLPRLPFDEPNRRSELVLELRLTLTKDAGVSPLDATEDVHFKIAVNDRTGVEARGLCPSIPQHLWSALGRIQFFPVRLDDVTAWKRRNRVVVTNLCRAHMVITSAQLRETVRNDLEITGCPPWVRAGETFEVEFVALRPHGKVKVDAAGLDLVGAPPSDAGPGRHRLRFRAGDEPRQALIRLSAGRHKGQTRLPVFSMEEEAAPWRVGGVLQAVRHERGGEMDAVLRDAAMTRWANYVCFRMEAGISGADVGGWGKTTLDDWRHWARLCRESGLDVSMAGTLSWRNFGGEKVDPVPYLYEVCGVFKHELGKHFVSTHFHEYSRWLYCFLPGAFEPEPEEPWTMKDACRKYIRDAARIEGVPGVPRQAGQCCPIMAYDYEAGIDYMSVEPNSFNASHQYAAARGAARVFGKQSFGTHNATQWCKTPEDITKLSINWLTFYWTYLAGGNFAYSEDGHAEMALAGAQYGFHSEEPTRLREIMREFYRFAATHPRRGRQRVDIAVAQGNYACEVLSFPLRFASLRENLHHVWGCKSTSHPHWAYGDPERGAALLDAWMPYRRDGQNIRHWFTGTPYGLFDVSPVAYAPQDILNTYQVLAFLGWNTMTPEIYEKLVAYVEQGGTLFMAVPQLSCHEGRDFLQDMRDLNLISGGDFRDLFGVRVTGPEELGKKVELIWGSRRDIGGGAFPAEFEHRDRARTPLALAALDGTPDRVLVRDKAGRWPVLIEHRKGKGRALLLTTWAYPGFSALNALVRQTLSSLAEDVKTPVRLDDPSREVAYSVWEDRGFRSLACLNTDWTAPGNVKSAGLELNGHRVPVDVREGRTSLLYWRRDLVLAPDSQDVYVEAIQRPRSRRMEAVLHGTGRQKLTVHGLKRAPRRIWYEGRELTARKTAQDRTLACSVNFGASTRGTLQVEMR